MSCTDSTWSSLGISDMLMWVYDVSTPFAPWKEDGGAARLPERVRGREDVPGSVALNVWFPITVRRANVCDSREAEDSVRRDRSLLCLDSFLGSVARSAGEETIEYTLIVSPFGSTGIDTTRRLVARFRRPVTVEEKDFLDEMEGERTEFASTWKLEDERRPWEAESWRRQAQWDLQTSNPGWHSLRKSPELCAGRAMGTRGASVGTAEPLANRSKRFWRRRRYSSSLSEVV